MPAATEFQACRKGRNQVAKTYASSYYGNTSESSAGVALIELMDPVAGSHGIVPVFLENNDADGTTNRSK